MVVNRMNFYMIVVETNTQMIIFKNKTNLLLPFPLKFLPHHFLFT